MQLLGLAKGLVHRKIGVEAAPDHLGLCAVSFPHDLAVDLALPKARQVFLRQTENHDLLSLGQKLSSLGRNGEIVDPFQLTWWSGSA